MVTFVYVVADSVPECSRGFLRILFDFVAVESIYNPGYAGEVGLGTFNTAAFRATVQNIEFYPTSIFQGSLQVD